MFDWFDSLRPINNLSVIKGRAFLGWTRTKLGLMFLLKDTTQWRRWGSDPWPFGLESSTLPLSHCAPSIMGMESWQIMLWGLNTFKKLIYNRICCRNSVMKRGLNSIENENNPMMFPYNFGRIQPLIQWRIPRGFNPPPPPPPHTQTL